MQLPVSAKSPSHSLTVDYYREKSASRRQSYPHHLVLSLATASKCAAFGRDDCFFGLGGWEDRQRQVQPQVLDYVADKSVSNFAQDDTGFWWGGSFAFRKFVEIRVDYLSSDGEGLVISLA